MAKNLAINKLLKSLQMVDAKEEILRVSMLKDLYCSDDIIIKNASCGDQILKLAKDLSKIATTYYGKGGAGLLLTCKEDGTVLMLKRSRHVEQPMTWGIPGGALSKGEGWHRREDIEQSGFSDDDFLEAAFREADEELFSRGGTSLDKNKMTLIGETDFRDGGFVYKTFVYDIPLEEKKRISAGFHLNWENDRAKWYSLSNLPQNLHFGVKFTKDNLEEQGVQLFETRIDDLDWIREYFRSLLPKISDTSEQLVKDLVEKVSVMIPSRSSKSDGEDHSDFRFRRANAVHDFFNYAVKELSRIDEKKAAIETMNYAAIFAKKPKDKWMSRSEKDLLKIPSGELSAHQGFFYHGSELRNALSILKSGTFVGAGAFTRLSLTSDLSVAAKFGDTIFVFDAKKLQRRGAKKMNYADQNLMKKMMEQSGKYPDENDLKNPWISDLYMYEKEWVLPLPYNIEPGDLVKIIYFSDERNAEDSRYREDYSSANEAFAALDGVTDVPIEVMSYPSFGAHSPQISKRVVPETTDLTEIIYSSALSKQATAESLYEKYKEEINKRFGKSEISRTDWVGATIYKLKSTIQEFGSRARSLEFKGSYDFSVVIDFYRDITAIRESLNYEYYNDYKYDILSYFNLRYDQFDELKQFFVPYIQNMKDICDNILSKKDDFESVIFKKQFGDPNAPTEENYIVRYFIYPMGEPQLIRNKARRLCAENIDKILSIPDIESYLDEHGPKVYGDDNYKWYKRDFRPHSIKWGMEELLKYSDPSKVPDQVYVEYFLSLIDSEKLTEISDDRLKRISEKYIAEGKGNSSGEKYDDEWIRRYRNYGGQQRKQKLEVMMSAMNPESAGFDEIDEY